MPPALLTSPLRGVAAGSSERDASDAFLTALESSSEEGANDGNQALEAGAGGTQETSLRPSSGGDPAAKRFFFALDKHGFNQLATDENFREKHRRAVRNFEMFVAKDLRSRCRRGR